MARDDGYGERHWARLLLHGPLASVVLASWSTLFTERDHGSFWETVPGALVMRQSTVAIERISCPCARAVRTWNVVLYFRVLVSGGHCSGCLGVAYEYENWILLVMTYSWVQCLVLQWIHALRQYFGYGRISHIFLRCGRLES